MKMKGTATEVPEASRGATAIHPEVQQIIDALGVLSNGQFAVFGFDDKKTAGARTASLKNRNLEAYCRGTDVYVRRPIASE